MAVVTDIELFKYYLTGQHFTVVTDHTSLIWLLNFRQAKGVVARWITWLQPFHFKIVRIPGTHHSHADGLSRRTSRPCKSNTCPECAPLLHKVTPKGEETVRVVVMQEQNMEHFGYITWSTDTSSLSRMILLSSEPLLHHCTRIAILFRLSP